MEKLRVLLIDNSLHDRNVLTEAVENTGFGRVEHTASNSLIAYERLLQEPFDAALLKVPLLGENPLELLQKIRGSFPKMAVIIISDDAENNAKTTVSALKMGAIDFILLPGEHETVQAAANLRNQLQGLFTQIITKNYTSALNNTRKENHAVPRQAVPKINFQSDDLVVIAASTGGPVALETICQNLPARFHNPVLVVQHMPTDFTRSLAQALNKKSALPVAEAVNGEEIKPGRILIAPGGLHLTVAKKNRGKVVKLDNSPPLNGVRPAADALFRSLAVSCAGENILAVILTGMGNDGLRGLAELKKHCGCYCIAQSEKSCVVYGMPKHIVNAGLADSVEDLQAIPRQIAQLIPGWRVNYEQ